MWSKIIQIWKLKDLRNKIFFTLLLLILIRTLAHIPVPGVDVEALKEFFQRSKLFGMLDLFSGGTMSRFSIAMMGVGPYINSSIIMQLLVHVVPSLEAMQKDGEDGRKKINSYTRWFAVPLAFVQSYGMIMLLKSQGQGIISFVEPWEIFSVMMVTVAGTILLMWLGELITEKGIGNGISLIITLGILAGLPSIVQNVGVSYIGLSSLMGITGIIILSIAVIIAIIYINEGNRLIPISYARRVRGVRIYGGMDTQLPLKINTAGVIPIIFAMSFTIFPSIIASFFANARSESVANMAKWIGEVFSISPPTAWYGLFYFLLVVAFTFFYTSVIFNPKEIAENIQKSGGFIPGVRPGTETANKLGYIVTRITLTGALFLGIIAVMPLLIQMNYPTMDVLVGGTGILIIVSVVIETARQLEAQVMMRSYDNY